MQPPRTRAAPAPSRLPSLGLLNAYTAVSVLALAVCLVPEWTSDDTGAGESAEGAGAPTTTGIASPAALPATDDRGGGSNNTATSVLGMLLTSKYGLAVSVNLIFNALLLLFKVVVVPCCFQELRPIEAKLLKERVVHYALFKMVFVGAILEPGMQDLFVWIQWFSCLGFLKVVGLLARDRCEHLVVNLHTPRLEHGKLVVVLGLVAVTDAVAFVLCLRQFKMNGTSVLFLLIFEIFIIFVDTCQTVLKYAISMWDLATEGTWEDRSVYLYYTEFVTESIAMAVTLAHYVHIWCLNGISFTLIDAILFLSMRAVFAALRTRMAAHRNHQRAVRNLEKRFPDASPEELQAKQRGHGHGHGQDDDDDDDSVDCAICLMPMTSAKKLPCGHYFHRMCLRQWLERVDTEQRCPMCRFRLTVPVSGQAKDTSTSTSTSTSMPRPRDPHPTVQPEAAGAGAGAQAAVAAAAAAAEEVVAQEGESGGGGRGDADDAADESRGNAAAAASPASHNNDDRIDRRARRGLGGQSSSSSSSWPLETTTTPRGRQDDESPVTRRGMPARAPSPSSTSQQVSQAEGGWPSFLSVPSFLFDSITGAEVDPVVSSAPTLFPRSLSSSNLAGMGAGHNATVVAQVQQIQQMFPHLHSDDIQADLAVTHGSVEETVNRILEGRLRLSRGGGLRQRRRQRPPPDQHRREVPAAPPAVRGDRAAVSGKQDERRDGGTETTSRHRSRSF